MTFPSTQVDPIAPDPAAFRKVMGSFATGVTIITSELDGQTHGMTANAFMSGSLVPPLCLISIAKKARMHDLLRNAGHFGVSILAREQERISNHFAGRPTEGLTIAFRHVGRTPVLALNAGEICADISAEHDCGDHTLFIGAINHLAAFERAPLLVHGGQYANISHAPGTTDHESPGFW